MEYIHSRGYIHRDVKPENFLMGINKKAHHLYCLDFGLAKKIIFAGGKHIKLSYFQPMTGTVRYTSVNSHDGVEQSRRDDLMSIGFMIIYFLKSYLPWMGVTGDSIFEKYKKIRNKKARIAVKDLTKGLPEEFEKYFKYVRKLEFKQDPDYNYLRSLFRGLFVKLGYKWDFQYDWIVRKSPVFLYDAVYKYDMEELSVEKKGNNGGEKKKKKEDDERKLKQEEIKNRIRNIFSENDNGNEDQKDKEIVFDEKELKKFNVLSETVDDVNAEIFEKNKKNIEKLGLEDEEKIISEKKIERIKINNKKSVIPKYILDSIPKRKRSNTEIALMDPEDVKKEKKNNLVVVCLEKKQKEEDFLFKFEDSDENGTNSDNEDNKSENKPLLKYLHQRDDDEISIISETMEKEVKVDESWDDIKVIDGSDIKIGDDIQLTNPIFLKEDDDIDFLNDNQKEEEKFSDDIIDDEGLNELKEIPSFEDFTNEMKGLNEFLSFEDE